MAWFRSKEQKQKELEVFEVERLECLERKKQEEHYKEVLSQVIITPESLESYQRRMGYAVEIIDTGERNKGVAFMFDENLMYINLHTSEQVKKRLVESGIEAVVEANYFMLDRTTVHAGYSSSKIYSYIFYGLPVAKRKNQGPYR